MDKIHFHIKYKFASFLSIYYIQYTQYTIFNYAFM